VLGGAALAVLAFRKRFQRWWGLPLAGAGAALVLSVALGWKWRHVVEAFGAAFVLVAVARLAGRAVGRRGSQPFGLKHSIRIRVDEPPASSSRSGAVPADPGDPDR
jgi:hypothetical protein